MLLDKLYETLLNGGWILLPIFLVGTWAFFLLLRILDRIGADIVRKNMNQPLKWFRHAIVETPVSPPRERFLKPGISYELLAHIVSMRERNTVFLRASLENYMNKLFHRMEHGLYFVGVLASVAPLLGLLGTVEGMVKTFDIITRYGNSNPVLLADGISEALLTTQSGLLIAFPLLLGKNMVADRIGFLQKQLQGLGSQALAELKKQ